MIWTHSINPVAITLGPVSIHWYGLMYMLGFLAAWWLGHYRARQSQGEWTEQHVSDLIFWGALGVILGGRFGYVIFYNFDYFLSNPLWLFAVWEGGMSFHGGLLGVLAALYYFAKQYKKAFFDIGDFVAPLIPLGLGAGRLGNFIGGELWGRPTDQTWGVVFPMLSDGVARHPSQLYQMLLEGVVLFVVLWWFSARERPQKAVAGMFLFLYGIFRIFVEFFREPDAHIGFIALQWLTMGQLLSVPLVLIGLVMLFKAYGQQKSA